MKKLYLSPMDIPAPHELSQLVGPSDAQEDRPAALIINAREHDPHAEDVIRERIRLFGALGMSTSIIDLRVCTGDELDRSLRSKKLVWVLRGNTFVVRDRMRTSGFEAIMPNLLELGTTTYGGDSAGALIAGMSFGGINLEVSDPPELADSTITEGLSLVPHVLGPHYGHPDFEALTKGIDLYPDQQAILRLPNDTAAVFTDETYRLVKE